MNDTHGMAPPPPPSNGTMTMHHRHMMMHMTFFWGKNAEILFDGWPGYDHLGMYVLALVVVFFLAFIVEWLSNCSILRGSSSSDSQRAAVGMLQTVLYAVRIGLAYLVMLAVMCRSTPGCFWLPLPDIVSGFSCSEVGLLTNRRLLRGRLLIFRR
ncbi:UNVERIFIED_CONTAM: Copper transporter 6 [Sesamum latifolium]|uniref:Copper transporter 6 n=1 Tax=Sesamum latifolium TaxID=2727402 RepID=A0AAW2Y471_9LAMI